MPAEMEAIMGLLSYQVRASEDVLWWCQTDQLLAMTELTDPSVPDSPSPMVSLECPPLSENTSAAPRQDNGADRVPQALLSSNQHGHHPCRYPTCERLQTAWTYNPSAGISYAFCVECSVYICLIVCLLNKGKGNVRF